MRFGLCVGRKPGKAPYEYITLQRMKKAQDLLQGDTSITQIAMDLNYTNPAKFAAAFRKCFHTSPSEWRRGVRG